MNKNLLTKLKKNKKGFTLIELIVVIAILGILAAIAIPRFTGMTDRAEIQARTAQATTILSAAEIAAVELNTTKITKLDEVTITNLITDGYLREFTNTNPVYTLTPTPGKPGQFSVSVPHPSGTGTITVGDVAEEEVGG